MDDIVLGRSPTSNAILVYNPWNQRYYEPDSYKIDPYCLPSSVYPSIKYDGGLFVSLHRDEIPVISEPYPPGTRVLGTTLSSGRSLAGTVIDIPFDPTLSPQYLIVFDDGTTRAVPSKDMPLLIPKPVYAEPDSTHILPPFLQPGSKITFEHDSQLHKGFLGQSPGGEFRFSFKSHINKKSEDWGVPLPNPPLPGRIFVWKASLSPVTSPLPSCTLRRLLLTSVLPTFIGTVPAPFSPPSTPRIPTATRGWPVLGRKSPALTQRTLTSNSASPNTGPFGRKGLRVPSPQCACSRSRKTRCSASFHAKSCIVVLGNHEDRVWTKPEKYAPILRPDSMRLMVSLAVEKCRTLKQGDCKNAFCQGILPDDEITIVKPPIGDPDADKDEYWLLKKTLYGLRRSPRHWYNKITSVLASIGLRPNASDPCMFTGSVCNPNNPAADIPSAPLTVGLYVDDFVYFSEDPEVERRFKQLLSSLVTVDFMGTVDWFLGTHFQWSC